ncbi:unnamed protein product [Caenorhabditis bovis]|uniref:molybdopterin molybdotransferase n=1 Tax=Caenorhabditis bovis TaxID=2654633 RepID=A0A8S1E4G5_9PELO|nr:unnamed protein product [Caenorhabditis bovis]
MEIRVAVLTVSDRCSAGVAIDASGPAICELVSNSTRISAKLVADSPQCVADERHQIAAKLRRLIEISDVIVTTGGTGFAKRDVTPEATLEVIDRRCSGLETAIHTRSLQATPMAALSRSIAGIAGNTLIVNFPGSLKAVKECWEVVEPVLNHAVGLLRETDEGKHHN